MYEHSIYDPAFEVIFRLFELREDFRIKDAPLLEDSLKAFEKQHNFEDMDKVFPVYYNGFNLNNQEKRFEDMRGYITEAKREIDFEILKCIDRCVSTMLTCAEDDALC